MVRSIPRLDVSGNLGRAEVIVMDSALCDDDADGDVDLRDCPALQRCFDNPEEPVERLTYFDADRNGVVELTDCVPFGAAITGPGG